VGSRRSSSYTSERGYRKKKTGITAKQKRGINWGNHRENSENENGSPNRKKLPGSGATPNEGIKFFPMVKQLLNPTGGVERKDGKVSRREPQVLTLPNPSGKTETETVKAMNTWEVVTKTEKYDNNHPRRQGDDQKGVIRSVARAKE